VDVAGNFPEECLHVLEILKVVYTNDAIARQRRMSPPSRRDPHHGAIRRADRDRHTASGGRGGKERKSLK
jgi:hypothetical protein